MRNITEMKVMMPEDDFEILFLPTVRVIGKETRCGGHLGNTALKLIEETFASEEWKTAQLLPKVIENDVDWMCDYNSRDNTFAFIHCFITPAGTPVPEGLVYRDIPETFCAKGVCGENENKTIERAAKAGYAVSYEPYLWNTEIIFPDVDKSCWLIPVKERE